MKKESTMDRLVERFIKYVKYNTTSDETSNTCPSTKNQLDFGKVLAEECKAIGLKDVTIDENGYVMAVLPSIVMKMFP